MIVEPGFLTHWKTQLLIDELEDRAAPLYVIALWSFCHERKTDQIPNDNPRVLKAICGFPGDGEILRDALEMAGFLDRDEEGNLIAHDFRKVNAKLFANWDNGKKGGRPRKAKNKTTENPTETQKNPPQTDMIRLDKNIPPKPPRGGRRFDSLKFFDRLCAEGDPALPVLSEPPFVAAYREWLEHRRQKRKPVTELAMRKQLERCQEWGGVAAARNIEFSIEKGWEGIWEPGGSARDGVSSERPEWEKGELIELSN